MTLSGADARVADATINSALVALASNAGVLDLASGTTPSARLGTQR
jgi:hypothetical protein